MSTNYAWAKEVLNTESLYLKRKKEALPHFPAIDCPDDYKELLCALHGKEDLVEFLNEPLEALGNRSIVQVLKEKDYLSLQQYIGERVTLEIVGPGAL